MSPFQRACRMTLRLVVLFGALFLLASPVRIITPAPTGMFQTACHQRHFLLSVRPGVLGLTWRFDFEDQSGLHFLSGQEASRCGYTILMDEGGALVLRASFRACHVSNKGGSDLHLRLRLVNLQSDGKVAAYPLWLRCPLQGRWSAREIICEENYMEVSMQPPVAPPTSTNEVGVMFHGDDQRPIGGRVLSLTEASALGYHISLRDSHLTLRCPYSSPLSYVIKDKGVDLEVVRATILYRLQGNLLAAEAAVACVLNGATVDGSELVWAVPYVPSPLVHGGFRDRGLSVGRNDQTLNESKSEKEFKIGLRGGRLEVRVPFGVHGGHIKSGVVRGQYSWSMSLDLFLMRQWTDGRWRLTQHRSFRLLTTPLVPQTPFFTRSAVPPEGFYSNTLGVFAADASLQKVTVDGGGDVLTWTPSHRTQTSADLAVSRVSHSNGSHSYRLLFPLSHPKIIPESIGGGYETYSFTFSFVIAILPNGETIHHRETVEHAVPYAAPSSPQLEGKCKEGSLLVLLHHGAPTQLQWELFLGGRRLDWDLVEMGGFAVEAEEDYTSVEIPPYGPGVNDMELTLQGLVSRVDVSVVDAESLKVRDRLVHECNFPVRELLACLPEGRMVAVVDTTHTIPSTHPNRTTLLDPSCVPMETDSARALFDFSLDSCGTTVTTEGSFLVYENQITSSQDLLPLDEPLIHRDPAYRLTVRCRYPANESSTLALHRLLNQAVHREAAETGEKNQRERN